jgi:hypothetical protein
MPQRRSASTTEKNSIPADTGDDGTRSANPLFVIYRYFLTMLINIRLRPFQPATAYVGF